MRNKYKFIILLILNPLLLFAEGQDAFPIIFGAVDLIKVFSIWAIVIFGGLVLYERIRKKKMERKYKRLTIISSALIALFIWSMIIHDSKPFEGPIDSIFYKSNGEKRF